MPAKKKAPALKADAKVEEIRAAYRSSAAPAAGRRRRTRPVPGTLPAVTPLPAPKKRAPPPAGDVGEPPRQKKPCFGPSETLEDIESRFLGATLPAQ